MRFPASLLTAALLAPAAAFAQGEPTDKPVSATMTGHIFKPRKVEPTDARLAQLKVPAGFGVSKFADKLDKPRMLAVAPNGDVYVSNREAGTITLLRDADHDGRAEVVKEVARKPHAHGLALRAGKLYVAAIRELYVAEVKADGTLGELQTLATDLPDAGQHANRTLAFGPDGKLYLSVGSTCNACQEDNPESATMLQLDADGQNRRVFARNLRNTIAFGWHPTTGALYGFDHGIDWLGDEDQREEVNRIREGGDYGWPLVYADGKPNLQQQPPPGLTHAQYAARTVLPEKLYDAHAAPLGMVFYTGPQFPAAYRHDVFVTMHGSWNRATPSGYKVVRLHFDAQGHPTEFSDFLTGFLIDKDQAEFGRPVGIAQTPDGALLVSDDANGVIYRVAYRK